MEMNNEQRRMKNGDEGGARGGLRFLVSLSDFKSILGVDDREDVLSRHCLLTATFAIEQYCLRRLVKKIINEQLTIHWAGPPPRNSPRILPRKAPGLPVLCCTAAYVT
jgi:hypothetical protein